jgi:hypothetical protein
MSAKSTVSSVDSTGGGRQWGCCSMYRVFFKLQYCRDVVQDGTITDNRRQSPSRSTVPVTPANSLADRWRAFLKTPLTIAIFTHIYS